ncbi:MAG: GyrI-like domain-containing protein, partial [Okeania sp. SIO3B3]|nr:GyrI-like domain-containing protein [Okeania sp. SIO3B3]
EKLEAVYHDLYGKWLPASGRELAPHCGFEVYLNTTRATRI